MDRGNALAILLALMVMPGGLHAERLKDHSVIERELFPELTGVPSGAFHTRGAGPAKRSTSDQADGTAASEPRPNEEPHAIGASDLTVQFVSGSGKLTPEGTAQLHELFLALASPRLSGFRFRVEGHTDTVGSATYNQQLSEERAATVVSYLTRVGNIQPGRLESHGYGKTRLAVPTPDNTPEPRNRRVRIVNIDK